MTGLLVVELRHDQLQMQVYLQSELECSIGPGNAKKQRFTKK
jgi:hypothetical protein